jgi:hypothetical protein
MNGLSELQEQVNQLARALQDTREELARAQQGTREELQQERLRRQQRDASSRRGVKALVVVLAIGTMVGGAREVLAWGGCAQTLPGPLKTFCAGDPALSQDINGNFATLVNWVEKKVGTVGSPDVTVTGAAKVTGLMSAEGGLVVTGAQKVSSNLTVNGAASVAKDLSAGGNVKVVGELVVNKQTTLEHKVVMKASLDVTDSLSANSIKTPGTLWANHIAANIIQLPKLVSDACTTPGSIGYRITSSGLGQLAQLCMCNGKAFKCLNIP